MPVETVPVPCPRCGERQNQVGGGASGRAPGGPVVCMVCQYAFSEAEYRSALMAARREIEERLAKKAGRQS